MKLWNLLWSWRQKGNRKVEEPSSPSLVWNQDRGLWVEEDNPYNNQQNNYINGYQHPNQVNISSLLSQLPPRAASVEPGPRNQARGLWVQDNPHNYNGFQHPNQVLSRLPSQPPPRAAPVNGMNAFNLPRPAYDNTNDLMFLNDLFTHQQNQQLSEFRTQTMHQSSRNHYESFRPPVTISELHVPEQQTFDFQPIQERRQSGYFNDLRSRDYNSQPLIDLTTEQVPSSSDSTIVEIETFNSTDAFASYSG